MAIALFARSRNAPLALSLRLTERTADQKAADLFKSLTPHAHRLRRLSLDSTSTQHYEQLFELLRGETPQLLSLDVSPGIIYSHVRRNLRLPGDMLTSAPRLSRVVWGTNLLPTFLHCLQNVTHLDISPSLPRIRCIFSLFPRMASLCIRDVPSVRPIQALPKLHPLLRLEVHAAMFLPGVEATTIWSDLDARSLSRVQSLTLRNYGLLVLFSACEAAGWHARALVVDYDDTVDATLARGAQECRLLGLVGGRLADQCNVSRLMYRHACLRSLVSLTMSLFRPCADFERALPCVLLHALEEFTLLCGRPRAAGVVPVHSLLDDAFLQAGGTMRAPQLRTLCLRSRASGAPSHNDEISPSALARFIGEHVQLRDGTRLPELRVDSAGIQFTADPVGYEALTACVESVQYVM
ncbi:hypothetical protein AURDEDRAFT_175992 [Auricularia subglabra TFB-10046 SS5]|nr:hypothetical protein AURDEDRAFT_175992 [Auricularia subglabra TFB-10046 SS5]